MARPLGPIKGQILDAAERLFAEHGFDGVSLRNIASAASTTQALVSYHFGSKLDLYRAMWGRWWEGPPGAPEPLPHTDRYQNLEHIVRSFFAGPIAFSRDPRGAQILTILGRELYDPKAAERGLLARYLDPSEEIFIGSLKQVLPEKDDLQIAVMHRIIVASGHALMFQYLSAHRPVDLIISKNLEAAVDEAVDFILGAFWKLIHA